MSSEAEPRGAVRPVPELEAEQEVDFSRYWRALAARWWLPVAGLVAGVVAGFLVLVGQSRPYEARAIVFLGQPTGPGGDSIQSLPTRFGFAGQLIISEATVREVAGRIGVRPARLRDAVSIEPISGLTQGRIERPTPLAEIKVEGLSRAKAVEAADALANLIVEDFSSFVDLKLRNYKARLARAERELDEVNKRIEFAQEQQARVLADTSLPDTERLIFLANYNNVLQFNENRQANLEGSLLTLQELIAVAEQVERARVIEPARASRADPPSQRAAAAVGGAIGLIVGILGALFWEPIARRLPTRAPAA